MISDLCRYVKEQLMCAMIASAKLLEYLPILALSAVTESVYEKKKVKRNKKTTVKKKNIPREFKEHLKLL